MNNMAKFSAIVELTSDSPEDVALTLKGVDGVFNVYSIDTLDDEEDPIDDDDDDE